MALDKVVKLLGNVSRICLAVNPLSTVLLRLAVALGIVVPSFLKIKVEFINSFATLKWS